MEALKAANMNIPSEVALIGFANEHFGEYITPSLSTIDQQTIRMGETAARLFFKLSAQYNFYRNAPTKTMLEPKLVIRQSSSKIQLS